MVTRSRIVARGPLACSLYVPVARAKNPTSLLDFVGGDSNEDERADQQVAGTDGWLGIRATSAEMGRKGARRNRARPHRAARDANSRFVSKTMIAEHQRRAADEALAPARALIERLKVDARTYAAIGEPAATIVAFAKKHRCTGIVMGTRGQGRIAGLMLGSVAAKVLYLATCPVTIIK